MLEFLANQITPLITDFFINSGKIKLQDATYKKKMKKEVEEFVENFFENEFMAISLEEGFDFRGLKEYVDNSHEKIFEYFYCTDKKIRTNLKESYIKGAYREAKAKTDNQAKVVYRIVDCILLIAENSFVKEINKKDIFLFNLYFEDQEQTIKAVEKSIIAEIEKLSRLVDYKNSFSEIVDNISEKEVLLKNKMHFTNPSIPFVGRKREIEQIHDFLNSEDKILFTAITGEGGVGKSKLMHHFIKDNTHNFDWKMCFISYPDIDKVLALTGNYKYAKNILFVVDYVVSNEEKIREFICSFNSDKVSHKIRILLLERQGFSKNKDRDSLTPIWYNRLLANNSSKNILIEREYSRNEDKFINLKSLTDAELKELIESYYTRITNKKIKSKVSNGIVEKYNDLKQKRTLFLLLMIDSYIRTENTDFLYWDEEQLISKYLDRYLDKIKELGQIDYKHIENLLFFSLFTGGWNLKDELEGVFSEDYLAFIELDYTNIKSLTQAINQGDEVDRIEPLYPDFLSEYFILNYINEKCSNQKVLLEKIQYVVNSNITESKKLFLRMIQNFSNSDKFKSVFKDLSQYTQAYENNDLIHVTIFYYLTTYSENVEYMESYNASLNSFFSSLNEFVNNNEEIAIEYAMGLVNLSAVVYQKNDEIEKLENVVINQLELLYNSTKNDEISISYAIGLGNLSIHYRKKGEIEKLENTMNQLELLYNSTKNYEIGKQISAIKRYYDGKKNN